jgi:hypothetical protein
MTPTGNWRFSILRFYWDDETEPSVEGSCGDFFGAGWGGYSHLNSLAGYNKSRQCISIAIGQCHSGKNARSQ